MSNTETPVSHQLMFSDTQPLSCRSCSNRNVHLSSGVISVTKWFERWASFCSDGIHFPAGGGAARPPGAMCLPHTNNMDSKLQGAGTGGGASLRPRAGGVSLEPFIHQVGWWYFIYNGWNVFTISLCVFLHVTCLHDSRWGVIPVWCVMMITPCANLW